MKLYDAGKLNETIMTFIEKNVRVPVQVFGDLRAQLAACHIAEQAVRRAGRRATAPSRPRRYMQRDRSTTPSA